MKLLKRIDGCLLVLLFAIGLQSFKYAEPVSRLNFNSGWKFNVIEDKNDSSDTFARMDYDDAGWQDVSLPHTAHIEPLVVTDQWQGICWYRKDFDVPKKYETKKVFIELEAAMNVAKIWINGRYVETNLGGYLPVVIDATSYLIPGKKNYIAIKLDNRDNAVTGPKPLKILDFNMYGGLYRNAWLIVKEKVHISNPILANKTAGGGVFITFPKVSAIASEVQVKTHLVNESDIARSVVLTQRILYKGVLQKSLRSQATKIEAGKELEIVQQITVSNAHLWSPGQPSLYTLETSVEVNGAMADVEINRFGIRQFEFKNNELYINGVKTFLRGVNRHQEYPYIGYALSDNAQYRDAKKIKEAGFDYIRLSHYPQSAAFLNACDELGLVVVDAILGWQYYADTEAFRNFCYKSAADLVRRDRNHPCVLAWEVSLNETKMPVFFMDQLNKIVHVEYPGPNVYSCGWMDDVYDIYLQARQHRLLHHNELKNKPYSVSEYGDWEYFSTNAGLNQDKMPKQERVEKSSRQLRSYGEARMLQQAANIQEAHNDNLKTTAFSDSYWVMYDYNRGYYDDLESSGIMDINRLPKFGYYFFKSQRNARVEKVVHIASYWTPESPLNVKVFSNCETVKLYLNNKLIAAQKPDAGKNTEKLQHPPFTFNIKNFKPGTLKAVGLINGKRVAEHKVTTPGKPVALKLWLDESGKPAKVGCNDVIFLYIAAIDKNGTIVPGFSNEIHLTINGQATVMNIGDIKAEAGIATALIKMGDEQGTLKFSAKADHLTGGVLEVQIKN